MQEKLFGSLKNALSRFIDRQLQHNKYAQCAGVIMGIFACVHRLPVPHWSIIKKSITTAWSRRKISYISPPNSNFEYTLGLTPPPHLPLLDTPVANAAREGEGEGETPKKSVASIFVDSVTRSYGNFMLA